MICVTEKRIRVHMQDGRKFEGDISHFGKHWQGQHSKPCVVLKRSVYFDPILGFWKTANDVVVPFCGVKKVERVPEEKVLESECE